jgi:ketosteroid isomerase-like protein
MTTAKDVAQRFWAAQTAGDAETAIGLLAPDLKWTVMGSGVEVVGTYDGPNGLYGDLVTKLAGYFEPGSFRQELKSVWADEERGVVVSEFHDSARSVNGHELSIDAVAVFHVADGVIREAREYVDLRQVELAAAPTP